MILHLWKCGVVRNQTYHTCEFFGARHICMFIKKKITNCSWRVLSTCFLDIVLKAKFINCGNWFHGKSRLVMMFFFYEESIPLSPIYTTIIMSFPNLFNDVEDFFQDPSIINSFYCSYPKPWQRWSSPI
jgi:hypothetical protein